MLNTDDFGIGDFTIYNREAKVPTPNIDRIGHEGVKFLGASSASSRCSPSRYMLMTGRYSMEDSQSRMINQGNAQNIIISYHFVTLSFSLEKES